MALTSTASHESVLLCSPGRFFRILATTAVFCNYSTFDYQVLTMVLQDFKDINERTMANTILHLALKNSGEEAAPTKISFNAFRSNKTGDPLKKEPIDKS